MHYDLLLKLIFQEAMPGLLRVLGLPPVVDYLSVEFPKRTKAQPDLVVRLADGRILHIELQSKNDPRMEWRCLEYCQVISEQWPGVELVQVVIYLGDSPLTMASGISRGGMHFHFEVLNLRDIEATAFLESASDTERMLAVLCQSPDPRATIAAILGSWKHLPAKELRQNIKNLFILSQLRKRDTMVKEESTHVPVDLDIRDNALYKMALVDGEGRVLIKFLERSFGPLPTSIRDRIRKADINSIDAWVDHSATATSLEEIFGSPDIDA
ncbi:MAG TPA: hypothetical protein VGL53_22465 [Bryobacteraceae bacterium]|jgi:hypothetical protein